MGALALLGGDVGVALGEALFLFRLEMRTTASWDGVRGIRSR